MDPLTGTFSLRKISNHFFNAFLSASYFPGFTILDPRAFSYDWNSFSLLFLLLLFFFLFSSREDVLWNTKKWSNILAENTLSEFFESFKLDFQKIIEMLVLCYINGRYVWWLMWIFVEWKVSKEVSKEVSK